MAEIYQAYHLINRHIEENFRTIIQGPLYYESIFNAARFLVNNLGNRQPNGINKVYVYYTLATLGYKHEAYKTARVGYDMLATLKVPLQWSEEVEIEALKIRSKPYSDKEDFAVICKRCMCIQPLVNLDGDRCTQCGAPTVRNFGSFDTLPLVEFIPEHGIPPIRVKELLR